MLAGLGINHVLEVHALGRIDPPETLGLNDVGRLYLRPTAALAVDPYVASRPTLIQESSNGMGAPGMIARA